jgi:hypothetical protein
MVKNTTDNFREILADEGKILRNGDSFTNRVTAPKGSNLTAWVEVDKSEQDEYLASLEETV